MSDVTFIVEGQSISVGFPQPVSGGEANTAANVGGGAEVFRDKSGAILNLRTVVGINGISAAVAGDTIEIDGGAMGDVVGPASSVDNAAAVFDGVTGKLLKEPDAAVDYRGQAITNVGNVDGRDVSADGTALDGHVADMANPHAVTAAQAGASPTLHTAQHKHGGSDEVATATPGANAIPKANGAGTLADGWVSQSSVTQHEAAIDHDALTNFDIAEHRVINDSGASTIELWSSSKIDAEISAVISGLDVKGAVDTSTEGHGDITLSGEQTLNGLLTSSSRVVVTEQATPSENGIYVSAAGAWTRAADADEDAEVTNGNITHVINSGSTKNKYKYLLCTPDPIIVGTTAQVWEEHRDIVFGTTGGTATEGDDSRVPTQDENDALQGTSGAPSNVNRYVTNSDSRNSNARTPTAHESSHSDGGGDEITAQDLGSAAATSGQILSADGAGGWGLAAAPIPLTSAAPADVTKAAAAVGVATDSARADHKHDITTAAAVGLGSASTNTEGAATTLARSNHTHEIDEAGTVSTIQPDDAAAGGSAAGFARKDHGHAIVAAAPGQGVGGSNAEGAAASFARSDHDHTIRTTTGPTDLAVGAIADGEVLQRNGSAITGVALFGGDYQSLQNDADFPTTSGTFVSALSITTPALTGTYRVAAFGMVEGVDKLGQYRLRNTTDAANLGVESDIRAKTNDAAWHAYGEVVFTGAAKTFQIQLKDDVGTQTQIIRQRRLELWRVA